MIQAFGGKGYRATTPVEVGAYLREALSAEERDWLDGYHAEVLTRIGPRVAGPVLGWLQAACKPL